MVITWTNDETGNSVNVGRVRTLKVHPFLAAERGESLFDVCDAHSAELHEVHTLLYEPGGYAFRNVVTKNLKLGCDKHAGQSPLANLRDDEVSEIDRERAWTVRTFQFLLVAVFAVYGLGSVHHTQQNWFRPEFISWEGIPGIWLKKSDVWMYDPGEHQYKYKTTEYTLLNPVIPAAMVCLGLSIPPLLYRHGDGVHNSLWVSLLGSSLAVFATSFWYASYRGWTDYATVYNACTGEPLDFPPPDSSTDGVALYILVSFASAMAGCGVGYVTTVEFRHIKRPP